MEKPATTAGASRTGQGNNPKKEKRPGDDHHVLATTTSPETSSVQRSSSKKARRTVGLPKAPPLPAAAASSSSLSLAVEYCPELFPSDALAAASQTCRGVHQLARREARQRWARIGWGSHTVADSNGSNSETELLPTGLAPMGLFSRVTAARVLEGLVVAAEGSRQRLCDRLAAFGARVVKTSSFSESLLRSNENIDFCVWGGFTAPPTKAGLAEYYRSEGVPVPPLHMRPPVLWEPVLESLLFSPWVSTTCEIKNGRELSEVQLAEFLEFSGITEEDIRSTVENESYYWTAETHRNVVSGDEVRGYTIDDMYFESFQNQYLYQEKGQIESIRFLGRTHNGWYYLPSWSEAPPGPGSTASTWSRAAATALYQQMGRRLSYLVLPVLFGNRSVGGCSWFKDWSRSATPVSTMDRLRQWRECLAALKAKENLDFDRDKEELYWLFEGGSHHDRGNKYEGEELRPNAPCAAVLRFALSLSFDSHTVNSS